MEDSVLSRVRLKPSYSGRWDSNHFLEGNLITGLAKYLINFNMKNRLIYSSIPTLIQGIPPGGGGANYAEPLLCYFHKLMESYHALENGNT